MDNRKELIERPHRCADFYNKLDGFSGASIEYEQAADAIAALTEENARLRAENIRWGQVAGEQNKAMDKLCAQLEQAKTGGMAMTGRKNISKSGGARRRRSEHGE